MATTVNERAAKIARHAKGVDFGGDHVKALEVAAAVSGVGVTFLHLGQTGPSDRPTELYGCVVANVTARGEGASKASAKRDAARAWIEANAA